MFEYYLAYGLAYLVTHAAQFDAGFLVVVALALFRAGWLKHKRGY